MAAGMRESAKFNPSDVPVFRSLGHWAEKGRANEIIRFVHALSKQAPPTHIIPASIISGKKTRGREIVAARPKKMEK